MAWKNNVPKHATLVKSHSGRITTPDEPNTGKFCTIELFEVYQSDGYKTDYSKVLVRYFRVRVDGQKTWSKRFSGRRFDLALDEFEGCQAIIS